MPYFLIFSLIKFSNYDGETTCEITKVVFHLTRLSRNFYRKIIKYCQKVRDSEIKNYKIYRISDSIDLLISQN